MEEVISFLNLTEEQELRERLLTVLLSPDLTTPVFPWKSGKQKHYAFDKIPVRGIPFDLLPLAKDLVRRGIAYARLHDDDRRLYRYNRFILNVLAILPVYSQLAHDFAREYEITSPADSGPDEWSGYQPLLDALQADIDSKWKEFIDLKIRTRLNFAIERKIFYLASMVNGLACYSRAIQDAITGSPDKIPYGYRLLRSQMQFITNVSGIEYFTKELFNPVEFPKIEKALGKIGDPELKEKFVRLFPKRAFA